MLSEPDQWRARLFEDLEKIDGFERQYIEHHLAQRLLELAAKPEPATPEDSQRPASKSATRIPP